MKVKICRVFTQEQGVASRFLALYIEFSEVQVTSKNKVLHALKFTNSHTSFRDLISCR